MVTLAGSNGLVVALWTEAPNVDELEQMEAAGEQQARANRGKAALLNVVVSGRPIFPEPVREKCRQMISDGRPFNWAVAHLILLDSIAGAGVRAFLTASVFFARSPIPKRAFGKRGEACAWMAKTIGWTPVRVEQLLDECLPRYRMAPSLL